jgi:hypothetical protein
MDRWLSRSRWQCRRCDCFVRAQEWTGIRYRLGRNREVFDAELYAIPRATVMARDQASELKRYGLKRIVILTDSQAALSRIQHNESGPGQTWESAIIQNSIEILIQNIQLDYRWVRGHAGIEGNETADQFAKDAAVPENEESSNLKKGIHLLAIYGGVLQMANGRVQMNGLSASVVAENTIASMTIINQTG